MRQGEAAHELRDRLFVTLDAQETAQLSLSDRKAAAWAPIARGFAVVIAAGVVMVALSVRMIRTYD